MPDLDIEQPQALINYLREAGHVRGDEVPEIRRLSGGVSNRAILLKRDNGEAWVVKQALEKLRVKADWFSSPERILREAAGIRHLPAWTPEGTIPGLVILDPENYLLAMEAVPEPHANWKTLLLDGCIDPQLVEQFADILASIHAGSTGDPEARDVFGDRSFFESLRLEPYYNYAGETESRAASFMRSLIRDTLGRADAVVHGDYSPKNILVREGRLILLDHEVIHYGDPAFDVGFSMTHFLSKANHIHSCREEFRKAAQNYWEAYMRQLGMVPWWEGFEARCVRHTAACLLARVAGRSPLEYLQEVEQKRQVRVALRLMQQPPNTISEMLEIYIHTLDHA